MADPTTPAPEAPPPPPMPPVGEISKEEMESGKVMALLSYVIWIIAVVNIATKNNSFSLYHGKQALTLFIITICANIFICIPILGWIVLGVWWIFALVCIVMGVMNAAGGECKPLPLIGAYGEKWFKNIQKG